MSVGAATNRRPYPSTGSSTFAMAKQTPDEIRIPTLALNSGHRDRTERGLHIGDTQREEPRS